MKAFHSKKERKKKSTMSEDEASESEFYYPKEADSELQGSSQEVIQMFLTEQKSFNTAKKTRSDLNNFFRYLKSINEENLKIENLPPAKLDHFLCKFFINVRKVNGEEYEPDTLTDFQRSIRKYLNDLNVQVNILKDIQFEKSRKVLAAQSEKKPCEQSWEGKQAECNPSTDKRGGRYAF